MGYDATPLNQQCFFQTARRYFYLRSSKTEKPTPLYFRVVFYGVRYNYPTGVRVIPAHWNRTMQRAFVSDILTTQDNRNNRIVNTVINDVLERFDKFINYISDNPDEDFKYVLHSFINLQKMKKKNTKTLSITAELSAYLRDKYRDRVTDDMTTTGTNYNRSLKVYQRYIKENPDKALSSDLHELCTDYLTDFRDWMVENHRKKNGEKMQAGRINDILKHVKIIIGRYAKDNHILTKTQIADIECEFLRANKPDDKIALYDCEVTQLYNYHCDNERDEAIKDIFILECVTGQRISDTVRLDDNLQSFRGVERIQLLTKKTRTKVNVSFVFTLAQEILVKKYNYRIPSVAKNETATKDVINKRIKIIAKNAGITGDEITVYQLAGDKPQESRVPRWKKISTHTARRTFITLLYLRGWTKEKIQMFSGHNSTDIVELYNKAKHDSYAFDVYRSTPENERLQFMPLHDEHANDKVSNYLVNRVEALEGENKELKETKEQQRNLIEKYSKYDDIIEEAKDEEREANCLPDSIQWMLDCLEQMRIEGTVSDEEYTRSCNDYDYCGKIFSLHATDHMKQVKLSFLDI